MGAKPTHSPEVKAAVMAALLAGRGMSELAREFGLGRTTVFRWRDEAFGTVVPEQAGTKAAAQHLEAKRLRCRELVAELLEVMLESAKAQSGHHQDSTWLRQQTAEGAAVLFGTTIDGIFRIAEALQPPDPDEGAAANDAA